MISLERCYIDNIKLVYSHEFNSDILLSHGAYFKQLAKNLAGEILINQIDSNQPPEFPRVIVKSKEMVFHFSLNKVEIEILGYRKHTNRNTLRDTYKHKIKESIDILQSYLDREDFKEEFVGILAPVRFPQDIQKTKTELVSAIHKALGRSTKLTVVSFNMKIGLLEETNKCFYNYEVSDYEVKNINLPGLLPGTPVKVDFNLFPTVEQGYLFVVDVNNRPSNKDNVFPVSLNNVVSHFFTAIEHIDKNLQIT